MEFWKRVFRLGVPLAGLLGARAAAQTVIVAGLPVQMPQQTTVKPEPSYGTASESIYNVNAFSFDTTDSTASSTIAPGGARYVAAGSSEWGASLTLPSGTLITAIEIQGCDLSATGQLLVALTRQTIVGGSEMLQGLGLLQTGTTETPGCGTFTQSITPVTVDNSDAGYFIDLQQGGDLSGNVRFQAVRLRYKLQVSPPPVQATFGDVPTTSPQFKFVEALAAAGITAGCGGGNYCPNDPITRGQMAVFLASALGLHWPN